MRGGTHKVFGTRSEWKISIHPPRAGRDNNCTLNMSLRPISIHPPRAGRDQRNSAYLADLVISIHPPRAGRDVWYRGGERECLRISIHPPRAGRDFLQTTAAIMYWISIHPPRAGRDHDTKLPPVGPHDFNPPAPCGAGQLLTEYNTLTGLFQSTRPVRGGTSAAIAAKTIITISIHPPRAGRDAIWCLWRWAAF